MTTNINKEIDKDSLRQKLRRFGIQAYSMLPVMTAPKILELGCGTGIFIIELAILSKGSIDAVDKDKGNLRILKEKMKVLNLARNIKTISRSFDKLSFKKEAYDLIWSEGVINSIGFEKGIQEWRTFLKPEGYMIIHDEICDYKSKLSMIPENGYELINYFVVPAAVWMHDYFKPLEERILALKDRYEEKSDIMDVLNEEEREINRFRENPEQFASVFYIMKKKLSDGDYMSKKKT